MNRTIYAIWRQLADSLFVLRFLYMYYTYIQTHVLHFMQALLRIYSA